MRVTTLQARSRAALDVAVAVAALVGVAQLEGDKEELPATSGSGPVVVCDQRECLIHEVIPQRFIKFGHLQSHPLAEGNTGSGSLLLSGLQTVLDISVLVHMCNQR